MILVDSSVWIDFFNGVPTRQVETLKSLFERQSVLVGDLVLSEVLQGFRRDEVYAVARDLMLRFPILELGGKANALSAAERYRHLRRVGVTVRSTIDALIASKCIDLGYQLLADDRDFEPFARHFGLKQVSLGPSS